MEIWEARRVDKVLDAGRTHPLVVECVGPQPESADRRAFIMKALALPEIKEASLGFELIGNLLARRLGVDTPEPVLIRLSPAFVEASRGVLKGHPELASKGAELLPGYGAGCEFLSPGFSPIMRDTYLTDNELSQAARIYVFDMLAQNPDRSFEGGQRPNCAHFGQRLIAYDFELCFSFVYLIFNPDKAWEVTKHGMGTKHVFHRPLRAGVESGKINLRPIVEDVATLDVDDLIQTVQCLPSEWVKHANKIEMHLKEIVANTRAFELELYRSLV